MIDARDYETTEELSKAMMNEHKDQIIQHIKQEVETIAFNENVCALILPELTSNYASLDPKILYNLAERIDYCSNRMAVSARILKSLVRLIPKECYENRTTEQVSRD